MDVRTLTELVAGGESDLLEFKRTTGELKEGMQTVCAMLNGRLPGYVLFGVGDSGEIIGQDVSSRTLEDIANEWRRFEPSPFPHVEVEQTELATGRTAIAVRTSGGSGPFAFDGRPYHRVGPTTSRMPQSLYERHLIERRHPIDRWENQPAIGFAVKDLDHAEITRTVDEAIRRQRLDEPGTRDPEALLLGLGLIQEGHLTNAAVVLFGQGPGMLSRYTQCIVRMARFRGTTKSEFIDNRQEHGHAFDLFVRAQRFLRDHLPVAGRILPDQYERVDEPLYPTEALREALANALCHRDYAAGGGAVAVAIYDDRLEISSTGPLRFGLSPDDLTRPHLSRPWNPLIAGAFYRRGIIETWGRGTIKMAELTDQAGLPPPEFEESLGEVIVRFRPTRYVAPTRVSHDLSLLQQELLEVLDRIGPAPLREVRQHLGQSTPERTLQDNLQMLRRVGLTEVVGSRRSARWSRTRSRPG